MYIHPILAMTSRPTGRACVLLLAVACLGGCPRARADAPLPRIVEQDPTLNHLADPPGSATAVPGTLGAVLRGGSGAEAMILIPGWGFGGDLFAPLAEAFGADYRTFSVTLPGFAGTTPPPGPGESASFGLQSWTTNAVSAIERLIAEERIERAVVVGHWIGGTQIALRLALARPEKIRAVVLLAGSAKMVALDPQQAAHLATPEQRVAATDRFLAPRWFKTVTRETWDDNNFLPGDYALHPVLGLRLWRQAARPPLHVWVRYLCEFNAQDACVDLPRLEVPTLLLKPDLERLAHEPGQNYLKGYLHDSWSGCVESHPRIRVETIGPARVALWLDRPDAVVGAMRRFLDATPGSAPAAPVTPSARP